MSTLTKTIKQYSFPFGKIKDFNFEGLEKLGYEFRDTKNFFYSRFSGISYINKLKDKYTIRDGIIKENLKNISKIPARYWKICLSHVLGNIKILLENTKKLIKKATYNNPNLSNKDRHYVYTVLKSSEYLANVLKRKKLSNYLYDKFKINHKKLNNLIRRYFRRYKNKTPYSKKNNFLILDSGLYKYKDGFLKISTLNKGKRIGFKMKDRRIFVGNLAIKRDNRLTVFGTKKFESKTIFETENSVAIDKGFKKLITTDKNTVYGTKYCFLNKIFIDKQVEKLKNRSRLFQIAKRHKETGNSKKAENIFKNNLGKIKQNRFTKKTRKRSENYINKEVNNFFEKEKPTEIIKEDLTWESYKNKKKKGFKNQIKRWEKGILDKSIKWKALQKNVKIININPAYTSQICNICDNFGIRSGESFACKCCQNKMDADVNAAHNIRKRKNIKEIDLYTNAKKVKQYYENLKKGEATFNIQNN